MTKQPTPDVDAVLAAQLKVAFTNEALHAMERAKHRISPKAQKGLQIIMGEVFEQLGQARGQETEKKRKRKRKEGKR